MSRKERDECHRSDFAPSTCAMGTTAAETDETTEAEAAPLMRRFVRQLFSRFGRTRPAPRPLALRSGHRDDLRDCLEVAVGTVEILERDSDSTDAAEWAEAAVHVLEGIAAEKIFPRGAPKASPAALQELFDEVLASLRVDEGREVEVLVAAHERYAVEQPMVASLIRAVGPGIAARAAVLKAGQEARRLFKNGIATQLVSTEPAARVLAGDVAQLRERIKVAVSSRERPA